MAQGTKELRSFGLLVGGVFALIGILSFWFGRRGWHLWPLAAAALLIVPALVAPRVLAPVHRGLCTGAVHLRHRLTMPAAPDRTIYSSQLSTGKKIAFTLVLTVLSLAAVTVAGELVLRWLEPPVPTSSGSIVRRTGEPDKQY